MIELILLAAMTAYYESRRVLSPCSRSEIFCAVIDSAWFVWQLPNVTPSQLAVIFEHREILRS